MIWGEVVVRGGGELEGVWGVPTTSKWALEDSKMSNGAGGSRQEVVVRGGEGVWRWAERKGVWWWGGEKRKVKKVEVSKTGADFWGGCLPFPV